MDSITLIYPSDEQVPAADKSSGKQEGTKQGYEGARAVEPSFAVQGHHFTWRSEQLLGNVQRIEV